MVDAVNYLQRKEEILKEMELIAYHPFAEKKSKDSELRQLKNRLRRMKREFYRGENADG